LAVKYLDTGDSDKVGRAVYVSIVVSGRGGPLAMNKDRFLRKKRRPPKRILQLPDLDHAKAAVLNSLTCPMINVNRYA
jgi:hypothetical protein